MDTTTSDTLQVSLCTHLAVPQYALKAEVIFCVRGVLSPLLSNPVLDELDRELERRGHHFVRYAGDCNIYVDASDGEHYALHHASTQTQGKPGEERRGPTRAKEVSRIQLHG